MFLLYYTGSVLLSINSRKYINSLSSCQNVWFCYCTEINIVIYKQRICGR